jgi:putative tryptophan/tyrosine transport system substrate-binding protein
MSMPLTCLERAPRAPRHGMRRRDFIALAAGIMLAQPLAAHAQRGDRVRRIAVLMSNAEDDPLGQERAAAFRQGLRELGWSDGQNVRIEWRWSAGDAGRIRGYAAEVAELAPELIVANGTANLSAVKQAVGAIPIVFVVVNDPVGQGFIASLAHPGGNITGFTFVEYSMFGKSLDLLRQVAPEARRIAFLFNPETSPYYDRFLPSFEAEARTHAVEVSPARVRSEGEIEAAVRDLAAKPGGGLIVPPDTYTLANRGSIVTAAARYRIAAIHAYRQSVKEGGLMSYGPETADIFRRSASYVDRILKGANAAELPAQAPIKFELTVNLKTAAALGLTVPPTLIALADEVIE